MYVCMSGLEGRKAIVAFWPRFEGDEDIYIERSFFTDRQKK